MKWHSLGWATALAAVLSLLNGCATPSQQELLSRAKVSETEARTTALAKVPGGSVKSGELEEEHGRLIWSFDIAAPGKPGVTEVQVDALTGAVASVEQETEQQERDERKKEAK